MRRVIAALIVVGLAVGVVLLWPRSTADDPPGAEASTTITTALTTTTALGTTTSTNDDSHVVETVEEAEEILRELWFGWFEGIYNQDEERIREVVVLEEMVERATESFEVEFSRAPLRSDISFTGTEILRSDGECLAVWTVIELSGFQVGSSGGVEIIRWTPSGWKSLATWRDREERWQEDCESTLLP
jgi:hypothetical protein